MTERGWRAQLVGPFRIRRLVLARRDRDLEDGVAEAAITRPVESGSEAQLEDGAGTRLGDREVSRNRAGHRQVALAAKLERLQLELDFVAILLPGAELDLSQIEAPHHLQGSAASRSRSGRRRARSRRPRRRSSTQSPRP